MSRWVSGSSVFGGCFSSDDCTAVVQLQAWCYSSCSCRGVNTSTLRIPLKVLTPKHLSQPHPTRALMSVSNPLFHHTCRNLLSVKLIQLRTNVVSALYSGVAGTHPFITPIQAKHISTRTHSGYELFSTYVDEEAENFSTHTLGAMNFLTPAANHFLHLCNCSSFCYFGQLPQLANTCMPTPHYIIRMTSPGLLC